MRHPLINLALGLCVSVALISHHTDVRAEPFQTCPGIVPPGASWTSYVVSSDAYMGFGQSFRIPFSGRLNGIVLETNQVPNDTVEFQWTLNILEADDTVGPELASDTFEYSGIFFGYGTLEFGFSDVAVEAGQTLFFGLRRQATLIGNAGLRWLYGSATNVAPYADGKAFYRTGSNPWVPIATTGANTDLRLTAYMQTCVGAATNPTITVDAISDDAGVDHVTLSGTASDPDRIREIWLDGGAAPIQSWTAANASLSPTFSVPIPVSGGPAPEVISGYVVDFCGNSTPFETTVDYGLCVAESPVCAADTLGYVFYVDVVPATDGCVIRCQTDAQGQNLQCALQCDM